MPIIFALDDFLARLSLVCQCAFVFQHLTRGVLAIFWSWRRLARFLIKMGCINFPKHQQIFKCLLMWWFYFCRLAPSGPPQTLHIWLLLHFVAFTLPNLALNNLLRMCLKKRNKLFCKRSIHLKKIIFLWTIDVWKWVDPLPPPLRKFCIRIFFLQMKAFPNTVSAVFNLTIANSSLCEGSSPFKF